ncbi:MFS transporter, partial [Streptomyces sp. NPDC059524]
ASHLRRPDAAYEEQTQRVVTELRHMLAGAAAGWTGTRTAIWTGGAACVLSVAALTAALPKLLTYDADTDEDAVRRRDAAAV